MLLVACMSGCGAPDPSGSDTPKPTSFGDLANSQMQAEAKCLSEAGWRITVDGDGYQADVPPEQQEEFARQSQQCTEDVRGSLPAPTIKADDFRRLYEHFVGLEQCLDKHGYPPTTTRPSEEDFIDEAIRANGASWNPYDAVDEPPGQELVQDCPQFPEGW